VNKLVNKNPNFSIVIPGGCNAKCKFCFNNNIEQKQVNHENYIMNLIDNLDSLPPEFYQVSITGGEPLLSSYIDEVLMLLRFKKDKYKNIVLTTNGTNLLEKLNMVKLSVDHINISRHHYDEDKNKNIFSGTYDISDEYISNCIKEYSKFGIDISVNCIINSNTKPEFIEKFTRWSNMMGFYTVNFRKESGNLDPTFAESSYNEHKVLKTNLCDVCRTKTQIINGAIVNWKCSKVEPSETLGNNIYEAVYLPNGNLYIDWEGNKKLIIKVQDKYSFIPKDSWVNTDEISKSNQSSCGSFGC